LQDPQCIARYVAEYMDGVAADTLPLLGR
jgi:hypothetical protein